MSNEATINQIHVAFTLLHESLWSSNFAKSHQFHTWSERDLLVPIRTFLLGYFGDLSPEHTVSLPGSRSGSGRIDFKVGPVAVEVAVRRAGDARRKLLDSENMTEVKKLLRYDGPSALVLLDFSDDPIPRADLNGYRALPSFGSGNWTHSPFSVLYYHADVQPIRLNIRV